MVKNRMGIKILSKELAIGVNISIVIKRSTKTRSRWLLPPQHQRHLYSLKWLFLVGYSKHTACNHYHKDLTSLFLSIDYQRLVTRKHTACNPYLDSHFLESPQGDYWWLITRNTQRVTITTNPLTGATYKHNMPTIDTYPDYTIIRLHNNQVTQQSDYTQLHTAIRLHTQRLHYTWQSDYTAPSHRTILFDPFFKKTNCLVSIGVSLTWGAAFLAFPNQRRSDSPRTEPSSYVGVEPLLRLILLRSVLATTMAFPRGDDMGAGRGFFNVGRGAERCGKQLVAGLWALSGSDLRKKSEKERRKGHGRR